MTADGKTRTAGTVQSAKQITEIDHLVGQRVREARTSVGMTQHDLADLMGRSSQQIQKYESGENRISAGLLHDMAIVLKRPISWFFGDHSAPGQPDEQAGVSDFDRCLELLYKLQKSDQMPLIKDFLMMMDRRE